MFVAAIAGLNQLYGAYVNGSNAIYVVPSPCYPPNYVFGSFPSSAFTAAEPLSANVTKWLGTAVTAAAAGVPNVNAAAINNIATTSVLAVGAYIGNTSAALQVDGSGYAKISSGTGTGQLSISSGVVAASGNWTTASNLPSGFSTWSIIGGGTGISSLTQTQVSGGTYALNSTSFVAASQFFTNLPAVSANVTEWLGTAVTAATAGKPDVSVWGFLGTALTGTAAYIVAAFTKFFNIATPTGTVNSLPAAVAGQAAGLPVTDASNIFEATSVTDVAGKIGYTFGAAMTGGATGTLSPSTWTSGTVAFNGVISSVGWAIYFDGTKWNATNGTTTWVGPTSIYPTGTYTVAGHTDIAVAPASSGGGATTAEITAAIFQDTTSGDFTVSGSFGSLVSGIGGTPAFTTAALANAPSGGGGGGGSTAISDGTIGTVTSTTQFVLRSLTGPCRLSAIG